MTTLPELRKKAVERMTEWQTMETAPKDGTVIDIWYPGRRGVALGSRIADVRWSEEKGWHDEVYRHIHATHWQPLPPPPPQKGET